jgi:hypothetical protein
MARFLRIMLVIHCIFLRVFLFHDIMSSFREQEMVELNVYTRPGHTALFFGTMLLFMAALLSIRWVQYLQSRERSSEYGMVCMDSCRSLLFTLLEAIKVLSIISAALIMKQRTVWITSELSAAKLLLNLLIFKEGRLPQQSSLTFGKRPPSHL